MQFQNGFSLRYGDRVITQADMTDGVFDDGSLKITRVCEALGEGIYTVNSFANTGDAESGTIAELCDVDARIPLPATEFRVGNLMRPKLTLTGFYGSNCDEMDYSPMPRELRQGSPVTFTPDGGRSCSGTAPYFELSCGDSGVILGIGWSGQWTCTFTLEDGYVRMTAGVENARFTLEPGETLRTVSLLAVPYENGSVAGHNAFRRAIRERCVLGKGQRPPYGRVNAMTWGAMKTETMLEHIRGLREADLGVECFFIDAGWYGHSNLYCKNEHEGDWWMQAGSWNVNPLCHPDGLRDVSAAAHDAGLEMLLWMESERAYRTSDWAREYPEYLIDPGEGESLLVDLGNPAAWKLVFDTLCERIETLRLNCYRQDFNCDPLVFWRSADTDTQISRTEIRYINGLYALWDALLARFPGLYIDNCASGGRRNDIELLFRSIPLWRSDYQCYFNAEPHVTQAHNTAASALFPYSGTGINGAMDDVYEIRSCYGSALSEHNWWWTEENPVEVCPAMDVLCRLVREYKRARPYFSRDFYALTPWSIRTDVWCVWQYHDPDADAGVVMAFRRDASPVTASSFTLNGLTDGIYRFENSDSGETFTASAAELREQGLEIRLPEKRSSTVLFYEKVR